MEGSGREEKICFIFVYKRILDQLVGHSIIEEKFFWKK